MVSVYLDHAASGPLHPAAADAMAGWLRAGFGNPSGSHHVARRARAAVEDSRERVAFFLGMDPGEVVFTSGGTEADNLAVLGPLPGRPGAVVVSAVEHPAVLAAAHAGGREVRTVGVGPDGLVAPERMRDLLGPDVALVSVQLANQETGVIQPLARISKLVRRLAPRAVLHTDAVQGAPWMDLRAVSPLVDLISISGHKLGGPQGVGALAVRSGLRLTSISHGGGQERERRSGTHNVAAIIGLGAAVAQLDPEAGPARWARTAALRDRLAGRLAEQVPGAVATAVDSPRVPGHCHFRFPGVESEALLFMLDEAGVCASAGSACASGALEPSPVLLAMGVDKAEAGSSLRMTLGPATTEQDVDAAAGAVAAAVEALRAASDPVPGEA
ncbi:MAG TPA: cysteine desulfurase family protein [Acidimicrobiales bacterium]|nr:cysteine desulfurase family protein [Acidimicrobiales bacterium]